MTWHAIEAPPGPAPLPITVRAQSIPAHHYYPEHAHCWNQMVYAIHGVLDVAVEGRTFIISPEQAVWLPTGCHHRVGSLFGAEFRSLWIAEEASHGILENPTVFGVTQLLKALIIEAVEISEKMDRGRYIHLVTELILEQLRRAQPLSSALPWPRAGSSLTGLCEALYANPADQNTVRTWCRKIGMSERTFTRRFEMEVGMSFRAWRRRLRLFRSIELVESGLDITQTAMELGYSSTSAFVYAFRTEMGCSPKVHMRRIRSAASGNAGF